MKYITKKLLFIFVLVSLVKILLNYFVRSPSEFADAYFYTLSAKYLISLNFAGFLSGYPPLYSLIISWVYLFDNSSLSYFLIKVTNSLVSSLIIFPAYLLAKEYLKDEKKSFYCAIIISLLPSNFSYSAFILSENIFNVLFLTTVYILYIGFKKGKTSLLMLSSLLIILCYATRITGLALIPIVFFFAITEKKYKEGFLVLLPFLIIAIPLILNNSLFAGYKTLFKINRIGLLSALFWLVMYSSLLYISGFMVFTNSSIRSIKNNSINRLFILSILFFIGMTFIHAASSINSYLPSGSFFDIGGRPMERYFFCVLPMIIIMGINNFKKYRISYLWAIPFSILILYPLLPPNNIDAAWLGVFIFLTKNYNIFAQIIINLVIVLSIIFLINYFRRHINLSYIILLIFLLNLAIFGGIIYNADKYYFDKDTTRTGIYLNEIAPNAIIVIDKNFCEERFTKESETLCDKKNGMSLVGFWNKNVKIGDYYEGDYFVSKGKLNLKKIKEFGEINIYET